MKFVRRKAKQTSLRVMYDRSVISIGIHLQSN